MLQDNYGRKFHYLRLSITDICNFKCNYCLPEGYQPCGEHDEPLSVGEITSLVSAFAQLGTQKIRLTGGEPSIRKDLPQIISVCKQTEGIKTVGITTNGYKLPKFIDAWIDAGLDRLNVSIDSLDPKMFHAITGHNRLNEVLAGLDRAAERGLTTLKINAVLLKQYNLKEFEDYLTWLKDKPFTLRFIELMQTGDNQSFFQQNHVSGETIKQRLLDQGWTRILRSQSAGPAQEFKHPDYQGRIGLIMPYSKDFCDSCNRLRISSSGKLHLCLFGESGLSLRDWMTESHEEELKERIVAYLGDKKASHFLHQGQSGSTRHLAMLGG